ncbi:hypothetical protein Btru_021296 [Bulinus truncatus]|nr:hypothetical protein Btru_021296 [Bulinus truncatus]
MVVLNTLSVNFGSISDVGHGFSELITVHITTAAGFILIALAAVVITLRLKGFIGRNELDTDVKQEKQQAINEYVGFPLIQPSLLPNVQVGSSPVEDNENNVYQTITDLPGRRPGDYIDMAPMGSSPSILEPDTIIEYLNVPESDPVNYENWQLPCEPRLPETDKESEKDGYVFLRVLRRARNSFRKSLNYQNVKLPWKRSSRVEANQEMQ